MKNDYEMTLNGESTVIPCEDSCDLPLVQCDFVSISDLENKEKDSIVGKDLEKDTMNLEHSLITVMRHISLETRDAVTIAFIWLFVPAPRMFLINHFLYSTEVLFVSAPGRVQTKSNFSFIRNVLETFELSIVAVGLLSRIRQCKPFQGQTLVVLFLSFFICLFLFF